MRRAQWTGLPPCLPAGAHALVLSQGSGMLPLLVARAGAGRVTAVERGPMLYRMAKQALAGNPMWSDVIHLLDRPLSQVNVQGMPQHCCCGRRRRRESVSTLSYSLCDGRADISLQVIPSSAHRSICTTLADLHVMYRRLNTWFFSETTDEHSVKRR